MAMNRPLHKHDVVYGNDLITYISNYVSNTLTWVQVWVNAFFCFSFQKVEFKFNIETKIRLQIKFCTIFESRLFCEIKLD